MKSEDDDIAAMRKQCANAFYLCGAVLSREGLQLLGRIIFSVIGPVFVAHQLDTHELRGPEQTRAFYVSAAKGSWFSTLCAVCAVLEDGDKLPYMGFDTSYTDLRRLA